MKWTVKQELKPGLTWRTADYYSQNAADLGLAQGWRGSRQGLWDLTEGNQYLKVAKNDFNVHLQELVNM